jgi:predicted ArsR family transcriptional regulator
VGSVPRLGPRVWHLYLLLEQPATATALSGATALGRDSVLAHLRTLKEHGLARTAAAPPESVCGSGRPGSRRTSKHTRSEC